MELIKYAFIISLITMGLHTITQKGMIFYFLRKPFDKKQDKLNDIMFARTGTGDKIISLLRSISHMEKSGEYSKVAIQLKKDTLNHLLSKGEDSDTALKIILYIGKPLILCPPCMASFHSLIWFWVFVGVERIWMLVPIMLTGSFINSILSRIQSKLK